jgi:hypothetical protein
MECLGAFLNTPCCARGSKFTYHERGAGSLLTDLFIMPPMSFYADLYYCQRDYKLISIKIDEKKPFTERV